jgi:hypothetical protein
MAKGDASTGIDQDQQAPPPGAAPEPGAKMANPAEPLAETVVPERHQAEGSPFIRKGASAGFPKPKWHPVHGKIELRSADEEAGLVNPSDWFDSPERADAARTWTEAHTVMHANYAAKAMAHEEAGHPVVRNSVAADEAVRRGSPEPL